MSKLQIIYHPQEHLGLRCAWLANWIEPVFEFVPFMAGAKYDKSAVLCTPYQTALCGNAWYQSLQEQGHQLIIEHLWDGDVDTVSNTLEVPGALMLRNTNWIWYCDSARWRAYGFLTRKPAPAVTNSFLMPMYKQRWHRDQIVQDLALELTSAVWSYASTGRVLQPEPDPLKEWVHHFDGTWYDSTAFSVVVESYMRTDAWSPAAGTLLKNRHPVYRTEVSEKIFKPMLGQHPFMVYGSVDTLAYLHREGFETFDNLWDESYDAVSKDSDRFDAVTGVVKRTVSEWQQGNNFRDTLTCEKIAHNHARLFDQQLVAQRFRDEIIHDILNFAQ